MDHWQDVVAVGLIAGAAIYLARVFWSRFVRRSGAGCDACLGCPSSSRSQARHDGPAPLQIEARSTEPRDD